MKELAIIGVKNSTACKIVTQDDLDKHGYTLAQMNNDLDFAIYNYATEWIWRYFRKTKMPDECLELLEIIIL